MVTICGCAFCYTASSGIATVRSYTFHWMSNATPAVLAF
jgi:hypothetical protein